MSEPLTEFPERSEPFKVLVSALIALTAMTGALLTWEASRVNGRASAQDAEALKAALYEATTEISIASDIMFNRKAFLAYQLHLLFSRAIKRQAQADPDAPGEIYDDWQREILRANVFRSQVDQDYLERDGEEMFNALRFHDAYRAEAAGQKALEAEPFVRRAAAERRKAEGLLSLNILLSGALFLFTLGLKSESRRRTIWAAGGGALYLTSLGLGLWRLLG